jgi:hypothetical protein
VIARIVYVVKIKNVFLQGQTENIKDDETVVVTMDVKLSGRDVRLLHDFGLGKAKLGQIDHVILNMFKESSIVDSFWVREFSTRIAVGVVQVINSKQV